MARYRLSSDIISPLNSDISLNDGSRSRSAFSFGSLPGTPVFDCHFASPICSANAKETNIDVLCARNMKECVDAFDEITNDIRKQSSINSEKEEKYKETYEDLKRSMDDLFGKKSDSSVFSPESQNNESKIEDLESKMHFKLNTVDESLNSENPNLTKKNKSPGLENISKNIGKKAEKCKKEKSVRNKLTKNQTERSSSVSELVKSTKNKNEVHVRNNAVVNEKKDSLNDQKKKSKIMSSKTDGSSFEAKRISSKILPEKKKEKETVDVKKYNFKCQKKIPVTDNKPINEHKSISIEKSIQLAIRMEMDHIRRTVLHQNLCMQKELMNIKEMVKKQNEVTDYLFSVVDTLLDANKELISKCG